MLNRKGGLIIGIYNYFDIRFSQKYRKHRIYTHSYCQDFGWMLGNRKISWKVFFLRKSFSFILGVRLYLKHIIGTDTAKLPESLTNGSLSKEATPIRLIQPVLIDPSAKISPGLAKWIVIKLLLSRLLYWTECMHWSKCENRRRRPTVGLNYSAWYDNPLSQLYCAQHCRAKMRHW